jgi:hypothetical protein
MDTDEAVRSHWKVWSLPVGAAAPELSGAASVVIELVIPVNIDDRK